MKEKLSLVTELIKLIRADKVEKGIEVEFIHGMGQMLGVEQSAIQNLFEKYVEYESPKDEIDRILQFQRLILMANVDQEVSEEEIILLKKNGLFLGLHPIAVENVLLEMRKHPNGMIPVPKFISIFQLNHN